MQKDKLIFSRAMDCFIIVPVAVAFAYIVGYWWMPISENASYYGFLSKSIANGSILHVDIPVLTNRIHLYVLAGLFKVFGANLFILRMYYAIFLVITVITMSVIIKKMTNPFIAMIVASVFVIIANLPHVTLDLGSSPHIIAICFMMIAMYYAYFSKRKNSFFICSLFLGFAAITRETYVLYSIPFTMIALRQKSFYKYILGFLTVGTLFLIFVSLSSNISAYLYDLFFSALRTRMAGEGGRLFFAKNSMFSMARMIQHLQTFSYGFNHFYAPFFVIVFLDYFRKSPHQLVHDLKYLILPCAFVIEILINWTTEYSIQVFLAFGSIIVADFLDWVWNIFPLRCQQANFFNEVYIGAVLNVSFLMGMFYFVSPYAMSIKSEYMNYLKISAQNREFNQKGMYDDSNPDRLMPMLNEIKHHSISTYSQFPALFKSPNHYAAKFPFIEDLSVGSNMHREEMWLKSLLILENSPPDILIDKTTVSYLNHFSKYGQIVEKNYIEIASFANATNAAVVSPHKDRVLISHRLFNTMHRVEQISLNFDRVYEYKNMKSTMQIAQVGPVSQACEVTLKVGMSLIQFDPDQFNSEYLYSFIRPNQSLIIEKVSQRCPAHLTLQLFSQ